MSDQRMAMDIFKKSGGGLNPLGNDILNHVANKSGVAADTRSIVPVPDDHRMKGQGGGFVRFDDPTTVFVDDSGIGEAHVLAHELGHSMMPTPVGQLDVERGLKYGQNRLPEGQSISGMPRTGSTVRYGFETQTAPTVIEEANAQGVAVGTTTALGYGNQDPFYGNKPQNYPKAIAEDGLRTLNNQLGVRMDLESDPYSGEKFGKDVYGNPIIDSQNLGIAISGTPDMRNELYKIEDNIGQRIDKQYNLGYQAVQ